ncbi:MAG TPA: NAD(P)-binding protein [Polyangiaceae bacterium]
MTSKSNVPVAILGAGLTGLSAALACQRAGIHYRLFERDGEPGGLARTSEEAGYRFDRTGHLLHLGNPALRDEVLGWLGNEFSVIQRRSKIWSHGVYTDYPFQANTFGLPAEVAYDCVLGFVEAAARQHRAAPANFEEYCLRHFGAGISRHFMLPYNSRLWGVPAREITTAWCERFVPRPTLEDVIAGAVGKPRRALGYNQEFVYPRHGIGRLTSALAAQLTALEPNTAPLRVELAKKQLVFAQGNVAYDRLVSSIPLKQLLGLCGPLPDEVARATRALRCTHLYYLDIAIRTPARQDWHWVYVPEARYPFYRVGCYSNFSECMAPPRSASLYVELADRSAPDLDVLLPRVFEGLIELAAIERPEDVAFARLRRIDHAYVIFDDQHQRATELCHEFLAEHGVTSAGRYGQWTYSSMEDALESGRRVVSAFANEHGS